MRQDRDDFLAVVGADSVNLGAFQRRGKSCGRVSAHKDECIGGDSAYFPGCFQYTVVFEGMEAGNADQMRPASSDPAADAPPEAEVRYGYRMTPVSERCADIFEPERLNLEEGTEADVPSEEIGLVVLYNQCSMENLAFKNDAALIIFYIKPDKTADFEDLMNKLKEGLAKSEAPEAKQQAAGMKLFKNTAANPQVAVYMLVADPVVKDVEYWFLSILYKAFPNDAQALLDKWKGAKADTPAAPGLFDLAQVLKFQ